MHLDKKQLLETTNRMKENILFLFQSKQNQLLQFNQELKLYNPHNFLKQGYARIVDSQGVVVRSILSESQRDSFTRIGGWFYGGRSSKKIFKVELGILVWLCIVEIFFIPHNTFLN